MSRAGDYRGGGYRSNVSRDRARERAPRQSGPAKGPKVLLFVQSGGAPPKCCGRAYASEFDPRSSLRELVASENETGTGPWFMAPRHAFTQDNADRWWLVECENADEGRHCITSECEPYRCHCADGPTHCRILAHGSRAPREAAKS